MHVLRSLLNFVIIHSVSATFYYPDPTTYFLEHMLVDAHGDFRSGFVDAITPCSNYASGPQTVGRITAAQWIRNAFHDFIIADIGAGTGGIDASISFETGRPENAGSAFNDSLAFFADMFSSKVSMSDLIALSVVTSFGNCGGTQLQAKSGRIDATEGGPPNSTPGAATSIEQTLAEFLVAGFVQTDAISLTACGHSIGDVHYDAEPTIVNPSYVNDNNTSGAAPFDDTPTMFDNDVVQDYVSGTGTMGGQLVTTANEIARSDLRLYESDRNVTVTRLANSSSSAFAAFCGSLFQKMIDTVPSGVVLTDVNPQAIQPVNATISLDENGAMTFTGYIRVLFPEAPVNLATCISLDSTVAECLYPLAISGTGSSTFGTTFFYPFSLPIRDQLSFTSFQVLVTTSTSSMNQIFPVQTKAFFTGLIEGWADTEGLIIGFATAIDDAPVSPTVVLENVVPQNGSWSPTIHTYNMSIAQKENQGNYTLWEADLTLGSVVVNNAVATLFVNGAEVDTILFPNFIPYSI